ncbi:MAG: 3-keto-disaccharide hydrolase, partial [Sphingobacterium sp.]
ENTILKKPKTIQLFNKKNLDGWYVFLQNRERGDDPKGVFTVDNGILNISGEEWGCITTNEEYSDYKLVMEFKWGEKTHGNRKTKARDNGLLFHSTGIDGGYSGIWMHSIECNIIEGGTGDFIVVGDGSTNFSITSPVDNERHNNTPVYQESGNLITVNSGRINWFDRDPNWKDTIGFRGSKDLEKPVGQWNKLECILKGDSIDIYLNDILVNQAIRVKPSRGKIQVQSEG